MNTPLNEKWFRSEKKLLEYLAARNYTGKNGRIYDNGKVLPFPKMYGQYSKQSWFLRY